MTTLQSTLDPNSPAFTDAAEAAASRLQEIEAELAIAGPAETRRLRQRAELIRGLLIPRRSPTPPLT